MAPTGARLDLFTPLRLGLFALGFLIFFLLLWLKNSVVAPSADIATARALEAVMGADTQVVISGRYRISGSKGRRHRQALVCGRVGPRGQPFAALILRRAGSKYAVWRDTPATSYSLEALALQGSSDASRQKQISWTNVPRGG